MVIAKDINTDLWNNIIERLMAIGWEMTWQYDGMDAGIDFSAYKLNKDGEEIYFEWTNWYEGEIHCFTAHRIRELENMVGKSSRPLIQTNTIRDQEQLELS